MAFIFSFKSEARGGFQKILLCLKWEHLEIFSPEAMAEFVLLNNLSMTF